jgi:hypothetical protein
MERTTLHQLGDGDVARHLVYDSIAKEQEDPICGRPQLEYRQFCVNALRRADHVERPATPESTLSCAPLFFAGTDFLAELWLFDQLVVHASTCSTRSARA